MRSYMNRFLFMEDVHTDLMSSWLPRLASLRIDHSLLFGAIPTVRRNRAFGLPQLTSLRVWQSKSGEVILGPDIGRFARLSRLVVGTRIDLKDTTHRQHVWGNLTQLTRLTHLYMPLKATGNPLEVYELPPDLGKLTALSSLRIDWPKTHVLTIPSSIGLLTKLRRLHIQSYKSSKNEAPIVSLKFRDDDALFELYLEHLHLEIPAVLPSAIGRLSTLKELALMINATVLPDQIGMLSELQILIVDSNHLRYVVCVCVCV